MHIIKTLDMKSYNINKEEKEEVLKEMSQILEIPINKLEIINNVIFTSTKEKCDEFNNLYEKKEEKTLNKNLINKFNELSPEDFIKLINETEENEILNNYNLFINNILENN